MSTRKEAVLAVTAVVLGAIGLIAYGQQANASVWFGLSIWTGANAGPGIVIRIIKSRRRA